MLVVVIVAVTGCSSGTRVGLAGPGLTKDEVNHSHSAAIRTDRGQLQDDIDAFFLFDRPGRMHRLSVR